MKISLNLDNTNFNARYTGLSTRTMNSIRVVTMLLSENKSVSEIAYIMGKNKNWVKGIIEKYSIECSEEAFLDKNLKIANEKNFAAKIMPLINKKTPLKEIARITSISKFDISQWVEIAYGTTLKKLYLKMKYAIEGFELAEQIQQGKCLNDLKNDSAWTKRRITNKTINYIKPNKTRLLDEKAPFLIQEGFSTYLICKLLNVSDSTFCNWVQAKYGMKLSKLRKHFNLKILYGKCHNVEDYELLHQNMEKYKTLKEAAEKSNLQIYRANFLIKKFDKVSPRILLQQIMDAEVPKLIEKGDSYSKIAEKLNVNECTIYRWVKKHKTDI